MPFTLPDLPYDLDALAPHISRETLEFHHGKHHKAYVDKLNELIAGTEHENRSLEDIIKSSDGVLFNQAGQHWNHSFYWNCMSPSGGGAPPGELGDKIGSAFGSYDKFREEFSAAAMGQFGSGWAWLVDGGDGGLEIKKTPNADLPLAHDDRALLTIDVWEHAYYIDFRNRRPDYISTFLDSLVNWEFVASNLS
jgi:Fe-Mn family superoxide dismutase